MDLNKFISVLNIIADLITLIPLGFGCAMLLLGALLPDPSQKSTVLGMGLIVTTVATFPTLCVIVFGAKGLLVIPLLAMSIGMAYLSLGEEGRLTFTVNRLKLTLEKILPPGEDEPERDGKVLKFESRPRPL